MKKHLVPWLFLFKFTLLFWSKTLNVLTPAVCLMSLFEAQEDQSETLQQTAASDEEKGTENQVLTSVTADKMSVGLLSKQFPSVTVNQ